MGNVVQGSKGAGKSFWRKLAAPAGAAAALVALGLVGAAQAHPYGPPHPHPHRAGGPYAPAPHGGGFIKIADRVVSDRFDRDVIGLPGRRRFNEIRLCVRRRAVEFLDLDVRFANGGNQDIQVRRVIQAGQCTRNIQLRGRAPRDIAQIIMKYTSVRKAGRQPIVSVYAR